jgi:hypothetical protein
MKATPENIYNRFKSITLFLVSICLMILPFIGIVLWIYVLFYKKILDAFPDTQKDTAYFTHKNNVDLIYLNIAAGTTIGIFFYWFIIIMIYGR